MRSVVFGLVWLVTWGRHHLWILPNLTEDCGFLESFKPPYSYKYVPSKDEQTEADEKEKESKQKAKSSDQEAEAESSSEGSLF